MRDPSPLVRVPVNDNDGACRVKKGGASLSEMTFGDGKSECSSSYKRESAKIGRMRYGVGVERYFESAPKRVGRERENRTLVGRTRYDVGLGALFQSTSPPA